MVDIPSLDTFIDIVKIENWEYEKKFGPSELFFFWKKNWGYVTFFVLTQQDSGIKRSQYPYCTYLVVYYLNIHIFLFHRC